MTSTTQLIATPLIAGPGLLGSQFNPIFIDENVNIGALSEAIFNSSHTLLSQMPTLNILQNLFHQ